MSLPVTSSKDCTHAATSKPFKSASSMYNSVTLENVVLFILNTPAPGSASDVVVEYLNNAESPPAGKKSAIVVRSPEPSKPNALFALVVASSVNSAELIVLVLDTLKDLSTSSCISWPIDKFLSNAPSTLSAVNGSFSTKSNVCVRVVTRLNITVSPDAGVLPDVKVTFPPVAVPALLTV